MPRTRKTPGKPASRASTRTNTTTTADGTDSAARRIDGRIAELDDWRGETLAKVRALVHTADPAVQETWKWRGTPVWEHDGILCTGESYKDVVKLTFPKGASLPDPKRLFNASLDGGTRRAIDIRRGDRIDGAALRALVRAAVAANASGGRARKR